MQGEIDVWVGKNLRSSHGMSSVVIRGFRGNRLVADISLDDLGVVIEDAWLDRDGVESLVISGKFAVCDRG